MTELQAIARFLRRSEDQLRVPYDLIRQGYDPEFLGTYRADETGQLDIESLKKIKRLRDYYQRIENHRQFVKELLTQEQLWGEQLEELIQNASTVAEIDMVTRGLRSRKSSRTLGDKQAEVAKLGQAILTLEGETPVDLEAWVSQEAKVDLEEAKILLSQVRRWLQLLLHEEPRLLDRIARHLRKKSIVTVTMLQTPDSGGDEPGDSATPSAEKSDGPSEKSVLNDVEQPQGAVHDSASQGESTSVAEEGLPSEIEDAESNSSELNSDLHPHEDDLSHLEEEMTEGSLDETDQASEETHAEMSSEVDAAAQPQPSEGTEGGAVAVVESENLAFAPPKPKKPTRKSKPKEPAPKSKSDANLSPRQRRRRWLRSVLEGYVKLRKPLDRLSPYQILMLGRGQRSQIIKLNLEYEIGPLVHAARESFCSGRHPLHHWLLEVAEEGLRKQILPKLEQDLMAEYEEVAHEELMDTAVEHLEASLAQRPIRGRTILCIDAIGPKSAALAVIDPHGVVLHTDEIPCNSIRSDVLSANVTSLGEIVHRFHANLIALSNGPARKFLIHTIKELLKQSSGRLQWAMVDRAGADAYGATRLCLQELPSISRRHRAAVWLGRRLQDPLGELLKIDPVRLRLGSYQRELPEAALQESLKRAVSEAVARRGIDVWNAHESSLAHVPGVNAKIASRIIDLRNGNQISSRMNLVESLRNEWDELPLRQAMGFLRIFGSDEPLDATAIHPDDYRLAQRLISNAGLSLPPNAPPHWRKPTYPLAKPESDPSEQSKSVETDTQGEGAPEGSETPSTSAEESLETGGLQEQAAGNEPAALEANSESVTSSEPVDSNIDNVESSPASAEGASSNPTDSAVAPESTVAIDVEKLARGWQVGRERLRYVSRCLQRPFADSRDFGTEVPLMDKVPSLEDLKPGMSAWAVIIGVADFGAFADLGPDCSGLIHVSRLSPTFVEDPNQVVQVGDLLQVWVVEVDQNKKRVALTALPPGTQQRRAPGREAQEAPEGRRDARGGSGNDPRGRAGDQRGRNENRRTDDGRRNLQGKPAHVGKSAGGNRRNDGRNDGRGRGRQRDYEDRREGSFSTERKVKIDPPKPIQPISDAMQKGKEPLRSFSDLMQFYQVKKDPEIEPPQSQDGTPDEASGT